MHLHTAMPASAWSQGVPAANLTPYDRDSQDPTPTSTPCAARAQSSSQPLFPGGPAPKCDGQKEPQPLCAAAPLYVHHCRAVSAHHAHCRGGHGSGLVGHIHSRVGPDGAAPRRRAHHGGTRRSARLARFDNRLCSQLAGLFAPQAVSASLRTQIRRMVGRHSSSMRPVFAQALVQTRLVEF